MNSMRKQFNRQSIRLKGYDYSREGLYFITICTQDRMFLFGNIQNHVMTLNPFGIIADEQWHLLPQRFPNIDLGAFIVMPNHIHGIIGIRATVKVSPTLGQIIGAYKSRVIHECLELAKIKDKFLGKLWQRNYYEHIIRNENDLIRIQKYIHDNPSNWTHDKLFPSS